MDGIDKRISRILGQLKGIQKMVKEERDCVETLQQISAVKKAIDGLTAEIVTSRVSQLVLEENQKEAQRIIDRTINL